MELQVLVMVREERKAGTEMVNVVHREPTGLENHSEVFTCWMQQKESVNFHVFKIPDSHHSYIND